MCLTPPVLGALQTQALGQLVAQQRQQQIAPKPADWLEQQNAVPMRNAWAEARARAWMEDGHKLIDRMAFWKEIPLIGWIVMNNLAAQLDRITDQVEGWLGTRTVA